MESPTAGSGISVSTGSGTLMNPFNFMMVPHLTALRMMIVQLAHIWTGLRNPLVLIYNKQNNMNMSSLLMRLVTLNGRALIVTSVDQVEGLSDEEDEYDCLVCYNPSDEILMSVLQRSYPCIVHFDDEHDTGVQGHLELTLTDEMGYLSTSDSSTLLREVQTKLFRT